MSKVVKKPYLAEVWRHGRLAELRPVGTLREAAEEYAHGMETGEYAVGQVQRRDGTVMWGRGVLRAEVRLLRMERHHDEAEPEEASTDTRMVELDLEESGILCHLILQAMQDATRLRHPNVVSALDTDPRAFGRRVHALYMRLADVNDALMGKEPRS